MLENLGWEKLQANLPDGTLQEKKTFGPDERFWKLSRNEQDKGTAIIRLIPDKDLIPYVKLFSHNFKKFDPSLGKDRWYIEDSPSSIDLPCPVSEKWRELMSIGTDAAKKEAETFKRKVKFIANILVIKDPLNPQNEGKVFLWEFGTKLESKFLSAISPSDEDVALGVEPVDLFHPVKGANIVLKIKKEGKFFNYDDTNIQQNTSVVTTEEEWNELQAKTYALTEFISPEHFESYDELKIKMDKVLNGSKSKYISGAEASKEKTSTEANKPKEVLFDEEAKTEVKETKHVSKQNTEESVSEDDELENLMKELEDI